MRRTSTYLLALAAPYAMTSCGEPAKGFARASEIRSLDEAIGGPKAVAQPGDLLLENGHARVAILSARNSLGPGLFGGSIVDADIVRVDPAFAGGRGRDQFAELFPTANMNVAHPADGDPDAVRIVSDGRGGEAVIRAHGPGEAFITLLDALWALVDAPDFYLWTDYIARADEDWFTIRTTMVAGPGGLEVPDAVEIPYRASR